METVCPGSVVFLSKGNNVNVFLEIKKNSCRVLGNTCELNHVTLGLVSDNSILQTIS